MSISLAAMGVSALSPFAHAQKTAGVTLASYSLQLQPSDAQFITGTGQVNLFFTTYNGNLSPLVDYRSGSGLVSGELRPRTAGGSLFEGGFLIATSVTTVDYGPYTLTLPTADTDADGTVDVLQLNKTGNFTATGSGFTVPGNGNFNLSITFTRASGVAVGRYSAVISSGASNSTYNGAFDLIFYNGTVAYTRGSTNTMAFTLTAPATGVVLTGSTTYTISTDAGQINFAAFTARDAAGLIYSVAAGTLTRSGNIFRGDVILTDGLPLTAWADFTKYRISITDPNDANGDGIPDLSDPGAIPAGPAFVIQPTSITVNSGTTAVFSTSVSNATTYNWVKVGTGLVVGSDDTLIIPNVTSAATGTYQLTATNGSLSAVSDPVTLTVTNGQLSRISNLSVRSTIGVGATLSVGFVTSSPKDLLIRAVGPSLNSLYNVPGAYPDPSLTIYNSAAQVVSSNNDWDSSLAPTFAALGAFALPVGSKDAALRRTHFGAGTAAVSGSGSGVVLVELYDIDAASNPARLVNVSARNQIGTGADILISGFVVEGSVARTVLVRGVGPALRDIFNIPTGFTDPKLEIHQSVGGQDRVLAANNDWSPSLTPYFDQLGAFRFAAGSKDSALLVTLPPGIYTAQLSGVGGVTGDGIVEVYVLP